MKIATVAVDLITQFKKLQCLTTDSRYKGAEKTASAWLYPNQYLIE
ncbi:hypothetical protein [Cesiribacter sp. SM1]|nr:hypothetical protein [Cesiribacter sp. SM1]